jgi:hypothetical protein
VAEHHDYFRRSEFRAVTGDDTAPYRYRDAAIDRAQQEVIERLEIWANTAWPNVIIYNTCSILTATNALTAVTGTFTVSQVGTTIRVAGAGAAGVDLVTQITAFTDSTHVTLAANAGTTVTAAATYVDGDGIAAAPRAYVDYLYSVNWPNISLSRVPCITLSSDIVDEEGNTVLSLTDNAYLLESETSIIHWGGSPEKRLDHLTRAVTVSYTYGFTSCPMAVKRPCIAAAKTLLDLNSMLAGGIPPGTTQYVTEGTTITLDPNATGTDGPWAWDRDANVDIHSYWDAERPRRFLIV